MFTDVDRCSPMFTDVHRCSPMFAKKMYVLREKKTQLDSSSDHFQNDTCRFPTCPWGSAVSSVPWPDEARPHSSQLPCGPSLKRPWRTWRKVTNCYGFPTQKDLGNGFRQIQCTPTRPTITHGSVLILGALCWPKAICIRALKIWWSQGWLGPK